MKPAVNLRKPVSVESCQRYQLHQNKIRNPGQMSAMYMVHMVLMLNTVKNLLNNRNKAVIEQLLFLIPWNSH